MHRRSLEESDTSQKENPPPVLPITKAEAAGSFIDMAACINVDYALSVISHEIASCERTQHAQWGGRRRKGGWGLGEGGIMKRGPTAGLSKQPPERCAARGCADKIPLSPDERGRGSDSAALSPTQKLEHLTSKNRGARGRMGWRPGPGDDHIYPRRRRRRVLRGGRAHHDPTGTQHKAFQVEIR